MGDSDICSAVTYVQPPPNSRVPLVACREGGLKECAFITRPQSQAPFPTGLGALGR